LVNALKRKLTVVSKMHLFAKDHHASSHHRGSDAGISTALRAHELDPGAEVTIAVATTSLISASVGCPITLGGETPDWRDQPIALSFQASTSCGSTQPNC